MYGFKAGDEEVLQAGAGGEGGDVVFVGEVEILPVYLI
jgi:hypothetical protein